MADNDGTKFMRAPVIETFRRKSPFQGLIEHSSKIKLCLETLEEVTKYYVKEDFEKVDHLSKKVTEIEEEADIIKGNIRNHLPIWIFMPVDRGDFQILLHEDDEVLDYAEYTAQLLSMRHSAVPEDVKAPLLELAEKTTEVGEVMEKLIQHIYDLLETSFSEKEREKTKEFIYAVHRKEWECDRAAEKALKILYNLDDENPLTVLHLIKVVGAMEKIGDKAENAADKIRSIMSK